MRSQTRHSSCDAAVKHANPLVSLNCVLDYVEAALLLKTPAMEEAMSEAAARVHANIDVALYLNSYCGEAFDVYEANEAAGLRERSEAAINLFGRAKAETRLRQGRADIEARDRDGCTPLHLAAGRGKVLITAQLHVEGGADVETVDDAGTTPLHAAARQGKLETVRWLVREGGVDADQRDRRGWAALHWAACWGRLLVVQVRLPRVAPCLCLLLLSSRFFSSFFFRLFFHLRPLSPCPRGASTRAAIPIAGSAPDATWPGLRSGLRRQTAERWTSTAASTGGATPRCTPLHMPVCCLEFQTSIPAWMFCTSWHVELVFRVAQGGAVWLSGWPAGVGRARWRCGTVRG